jgi:DNA-binding HxlR family transcriptional regulator
MTTARPNVLDPACGSRRVVDMLADTWSVLVIYALDDDCLRYRQIEQRVGGISQKMLTQTLRKLTRHGLVAAVRDGDGYELTALGRSLLDEVLGPLCAWAQGHVDDVREQRPAPATGGGCAPPRS